MLFPSTSESVSYNRLALPLATVMLTNGHFCASSSSHTPQGPCHHFQESSHSYLHQKCLHSMKQWWPFSLWKNCRFIYTITVSDHYNSHSPVQLIQRLQLIIQDIIFLFPLSLCSSSAHISHFQDTTATWGQQLIQKLWKVQSSKFHIAQFIGKLLRETWMGKLPLKYYYARVTMNKCRNYTISQETGNKYLAVIKQ